MGIFSGRAGDACKWFWMGGGGLMMMVYYRRRDGEDMVHDIIMGDIFYH